jgi:hypothetical protein
MSAGRGRGRRSRAISLVCVSGRIFTSRLREWSIVTERSDDYRRAAEVRRSQMGAEEPPRHRARMGDIEERQRIPGTDRAVRITGWRNPTLTAAVSAASELAGDNIPVAVAAGVAAEVAQRYTHLTSAEIAVLDLLGRLAQGGSIYKVWIDEDRLLDAMDLLEHESSKRLLANMKSRELLEEGAGKWRAIR